MNTIHPRIMIPLGAAILSALVPAIVGAGSIASGDWISLFDGKSLDGWIVKCLPKDQDKQYWKVLDGTIVSDVPAGSDHKYIWLLTEKEYDDFVLELLVQTYPDSSNNSGVQVRSRYDDEKGWLDGPQVDINPNGGWRSGFIYDETRDSRGWLSPIQGKASDATIDDAAEGWTWYHADKDDLWNKVRIICKGTRIKTIVNGITVADYDGSGVLDDPIHARYGVGMKGQIGLQIHPGGKGRIRFKDIRIKPLLPPS